MPHRGKRSRAQIEIDNHRHAKECKNCRKVKPFTEFHKNSANGDGFRSDCKPCHYQRNEAHRRVKFSRIQWPLRFWMKVKVVGECWVWQGARTREGYGALKVPWRRWAKAHRVGYQLIRGRIPDGEFVCHHCDNKLCVRFDHLYHGGPISNNRDTVRRHRQERRDKRYVSSMLFVGGGF